MSVAASGFLSEPLDALRALISRSGAWQVWCGVSTEAEALARIHIGSAAVDEVEPYAILDLSDSWSRMRQTLTAGDWRSDGWLLVYIRDTVAAGLVDPDALMTFSNRLGALVEDLERLGTQRPLLLTSIEVRGLARTEEHLRETQGDHWEALLAIGVKVF